MEQSHDAIRVMILDTLGSRARQTREMLAAQADGQMSLQHHHCFRVVERAVVQQAVDVVVVHVDDRQGHDMVAIARLQRMRPAVAVVTIAAPTARSLLHQTFGDHLDDCLEDTSLTGETLFHSIRLAIERKCRRKVEERLHQSDIAMRMAREIQFQLFPVGSPSIEGIEIAGASFPAEEIDGDYYDYFALGDGSLAIAVGDACGHGMAAALLMAETRASLRTAAINSSDPAEILQQVNDILQEGMPSNRFVTLALIRLDWRRRRATFASAGHVPG